MGLTGDWKPPVPPVGAVPAALWEGSSQLGLKIEAQFVEKCRNFISFNINNYHDLFWKHHFHAKPEWQEDCPYRDDNKPILVAVHMRVC